MSVAIAPPFPVYTGLDGDPLDGGKIYVGTANLDPVTNPVQLYWNEALTITAAQPIRTSGGYPVRNGTPSNIYTGAGTFSITVKDAQDVTVFTAASVSNLSGPGGADLIGYGDVTVADILDNALYDVSYGVVADGVTNDSAAQNAFLAALSARGGVGIMKPGPRLFGSQVTWNRAFPTVTSNALLIADGVIVKTTHNGTAFRINGSPGEFLWTELRGLTVNEQTNSTSKGGIEQVNTACVVLRNCHNRSNGDVMTASYKPYWIRQADPLVPDTGSFWTWHLNCSVRRTGTTYLNNAVVLQGSANATTIQGGVYSGVSDGVKFQNEPGGTPYLANGCTILDSAFEGITGNAVRVAGNVGQQTALGLRIIGGRFETIGGAVLSLEGATANTPRCPSVFMPAVDTTVGAIVNNPNNLNVDINFIDTDRTTQSIEQTGAGKIIRSQFAVNDVLDLQTANTGSGLRISNISGSDNYGWLRAISGGLELAGNVAASFFLKLSGVAGISGTATRSNNLRGTVALVAVSSQVVTFPVAEPNATYFVYLTPRAVNGGCWVSARGTADFTINFNAAYTGNVDWLLIR
jgi:hypothetical protein